MEGLKNEQTETLTPTAGAEVIKEGENKQEVSLGKFKDVQALLSAYGALEAEFTKIASRITHYEVDGNMLMLLSNGEVHAIFQAVNR